MKLQRENKIPTKPRFNFVTDTAYDFLLEYGYNKFPISPFKVLEDLSEYVSCIPWSEAKKVLKSSDPFHLTETGAEARTIRLRDTGMYLMVYDDVHFNSDHRIGWTIMHEIGHIVLGHLTDFEQTALNRGGLTKTGYEVLEIEAHYFAAEVMMPTALLKHFKSIEIEEISLLFDVSEEAAQKKYKRVFKVDYMPHHPCEGKLIRNFFDFLENDLDRTIYDNIYGTWGIPYKNSYTKICRKCPECLTYISDRKAIYCPYCGAEIDKRPVYKNTFQRLGERQKFAKLPGVSHPELLTKRITLPGGETIERLCFCHNCLNHAIDDDAEYCNICGEPLYSTCLNDETWLKINECFCPSCGSESPLHNSYLKAEERLMKINDCSSCTSYSNEWIQYPYWGFIKSRLFSNSSGVTDELRSAIFYSNAYIDDNDNVIVYTDTAIAAVCIEKEKGIILRVMNQYDEYEYSTLEVLVANDI